ncbi:hypothetical protein Nepgr_025217 [Nepenthes gracilis]|uniref:Uncharacterized protein n=1 Tax=Nepenthes gracilis TaxID=150966 RepID=A0AAD3T6H8_NEPGR|nr:hypothetical protein Nepgr_025217 [Nepenthes gracilis]
MHCLFVPPTGVHPLDVFGCDNTLKHTVVESTRPQWEPVQHLVNYELCSESKNEGLELTAIAASRVSPNESPSVAIIPGVTNASEINITEIVGGVSAQKISEGYPLPTVMGSSNGMVDYSEGKSKMKGLRSVQGIRERIVFQGEQDPRQLFGWNKDVVFNVPLEFTTMNSTKRDNREGGSEGSLRAARNAVILRSLTSGSTSKGMKMEVVKAMIVPTLGTLILLVIEQMVLQRQKVAETS